MDKNDDCLLTADDLAEMLNWSRWSVYRSYAGLGIPHLRAAGSLRFRRASVRRWLAAQESR